MKKHILILLSIIFYCSCSKDLTINPEGKMTQEEMQEMVKKDPETVLAPLVETLNSSVNNYTYANSVDTKNLAVLNILLSLKGNDMVQVRTGWMNGDYKMLDYREETATRVQPYWGTFYRLIYLSNQILGIIPPDIDLTTVTNENKAIMKYRASALTVKAYAYTYLMWLYQDDYLHGGKDKAGVPMADYFGNPQPRSSSKEIWSMILTDATEAVRLFKASGYYKTDDRTDIDGSVASFVLARAALTTGNWNTAIAAAKDVITEYPTLFTESEYLNSGMTLLSSETIYGYKYASTSGKGTSSFPGWMNVYGEGGYGGSQATCWVAIDQRLYDQISETDYRKKNFVKDKVNYTYPKSGEPVQFLKYYQLKFGTTVKNDNTAYNQNEIYMRTSEMILTKAEAEVRSGANSDAQNTLFDLVSKRDPSYTKSTKIGDALFTEIQLHRRIELWGEGGMEFYDNKRWDIGVDRTTSQNHQEKVNIPAGKNFTLQIPLNTEINYNPHITATEQNPL